MADNRIRVLIDVVTDKASTSIKRFRTDLSSAEGAMGKLRVTGSAALGAIKANAAELAVAAAGAFVAFATKAVGAFQELALEAGKFADATGIAVEDASRWIEVAGDLGIESSKVETAMMRMNKAIADGKLDEFSDSIVLVDDGAVDANASFRNLITTIGAIQDPTERAKAAQDAFGRSYGEVAELMEMSATDLAAALGSVSDAKVIDDAELRRARDFRAAMDELSDKVGDAALELGERLVPALLSVVEGVDDIAQAAGKIDGFGRVIGKEGLTGKVAGLLDEVIPFDNIASGLARTFDKDSSAGERFGGVVEFLAGGVPILGEKISDLNDNELDLALSSDLVREALRGGADDYIEFAAAMADANSNVIDFDASLVDMGDEAEDTQRKIEQLQAGVERLQGALSKRDAFDAAVEGWNRVLWTSTAATNAEAAGAENAAELRAEANEEIRNSINATLDYISTVGGIPSEQTTEIEALIDQGKYDEVERMLQQLARRRTASIEAIGSLLGRERRAAGGPVSAGGTYLVGERGPELVTMAGNGHVTPNHALRGAASSAGGGTWNVTVNMPPGSDGEDVVRAIRNFERRNGKGWRS